MVTTSPLWLGKAGGGRPLRWTVWAAAPAACPSPATPGLRSLALQRPLGTNVWPTCLVGCHGEQAREVTSLSQWQSQATGAHAPTRKVILLPQPPRVLVIGMHSHTQLQFLEFVSTRLCPPKSLISELRSPSVAPSYPVFPSFFLSLSFFLCYWEWNPGWAPSLSYIPSPFYFGRHSP